VAHHNTYAAELDHSLWNLLLVHRLTIIKVSRSKQSSGSTATRILGTTHYLVTLVRSGHGRSIIAGMVRVHGTRYLSVKRDRSTHSKSAAIGVRGASASNIQVGGGGGDLWIDLGEYHILKASKIRGLLGNEP
jgi:hypothetical protein